eukprot:TRINITY_DN1854_c0_g1_i1.p1 TRINITY_DN1854_c0_g1~~TRINITY_DN1854_c0_g1_i1.p1  ORF type:complete len:286 (-),score=24.62 TRINITY_DN1854_c0_g1_i1:70-927(-)
MDPSLRSSSKRKYAHDAGTIADDFGKRLRCLSQSGSLSDMETVSQHLGSPLLVPPMMENMETMEVDNGVNASEAPEFREGLCLSPDQAMSDSSSGSRIDSMEAPFVEDFSKAIVLYRGVQPPLFPGGPPIGSVPFTLRTAFNFAPPSFLEQMYLPSSAPKDSKAHQMRGKDTQESARQRRFAAEDSSSSQYNNVESKVLTGATELDAQVQALPLSSQLAIVPWQKPAASFEMYQKNCSFANIQNRKPFRYIDQQQPENFYFPSHANGFWQAVDCIAGGGSSAHLS